MKPTRIVLLSLVMLLMLASCTRGTIYTQFNEIPHAEWCFDSIVEFRVEVESNQPAPHHVITTVCHDTSYPYQNFWYYVECEHPDGAITTDTIECYLANARGQWLGGGVRHIKQMPVLIDQNATFPQVGTYTYRIQHAMRDDILQGIHSLGLEIVQQH